MRVNIQNLFRSRVCKAFLNVWDRSRHAAIFFWICRVACGCNTQWNFGIEKDQHANFMAGAAAAWRLESSVAEVTLYLDCRKRNQAEDGVSGDASVVNAIGFAKCANTPSTHLFVSVKFALLAQHSAFHISQLHALHVYTPQRHSSYTTLRAQLSALSTSGSTLHTSHFAFAIFPAHHAQCISFHVLPLYTLHSTARTPHSALYTSG